MKKALLTAVCVLALAALALFFVPGFIPRTDVYISDCSLSADGSELTVTACVAGSMGFIRSCRTNCEGSRCELTFYCAFGGLNSSLGAQNRFTIPITADCTELCIRRDSGELETVLTKDDLTGEWELIRG